jgi:hypothetical protein
MPASIMGRNHSFETRPPAFTNFNTFTLQASRYEPPLDTHHVGNQKNFHTERQLQRNPLKFGAMNWSPAPGSSK